MNTVVDNWINPDLEKIINNRAIAATMAQYDTEFRARVLYVCKNHPERFISDWVWTSDPRNAARGVSVTIPFVLYPRQVEYLKWRRECLYARKWGVHAKSRDSGASWLNCADQIHHWLFTPGFKGGFGSNKEIKIDRKGDPDAIFSKLRFIIKTLPKWMVPSRFDDNYMKLINHDNGAVITGEAGDNIGRGGRSLLYDWDEAAFTEHQDMVLAALSENTDCCIRTSTPNGADDRFAIDYLSGNYPTFCFHWKQDPRKNYWVVPSTGQTGTGTDAPLGAIYPWYEEKKKRFSPLLLAREIDVDFNASKEGTVIRHEWILAAVNYPINSHNSTKLAGLDIATEGKDRSVIVICAGSKIIHIESWSGQNTTETANRAIALCHQHGVEQLNFDVVGVGAGVSGVLQTTQNLRFRYNPINGGSSPSDIFWASEQRTSKQKFYNRRAELYYLAAERFRKTWENVNGVAEHSTDDCISIPNNPTLIAQLSMTAGSYAENGKLILTPKNKMRISPDFADALVYSLVGISDASWQVTRARW